MEQFLLNNAVLTILVGGALTVGGYHAGDKMFWRCANRHGAIAVITVIAALLAILAVMLIWKAVVLSLFGIAVSSFALGAFVEAVSPGHRN